MTVPYMTGKRLPLRATFVASILRNPDMSKVIRRAPIAPSGGDIYVFQIENGSQRQGWKNDNIHFHHDGTRRQPKNNPVVRKIFFCAMTGDGRWTREFMKHVYTLYYNPNSFVLIHYLGNEGVARDVPRHRKPRSSSKKQTTRSSTAVQVDTSELSPQDGFSSEEEDVQDVDHEDEDDDDGRILSLEQPVIELGVMEADSGLGQSLILMQQSSFLPEGVVMSEASTSTQGPLTSTPVSSNLTDPISLSYLDMMPPMPNPLGILSEVTLSCRPMEQVAQADAGEATTSSLSSFSGGRGASFASTSRDSESSEQISLIPKKRPAMRVEGSDTNSNADGATNEISVQTPKRIQQQQHTLTCIPKKRRLDFSDGSTEQDQNSVTDNIGDSAEDILTQTEQNNMIPNNETQVDMSDSHPQTRARRISIREGLQSSLSSLVDNIRHIETVLASSDMWEMDTESCDKQTEDTKSQTSLDSYICALVSSGQLALIVTKVMQQLMTWKQRPRALNVRTNPCMTLISQVTGSWGEEMEIVRKRLMTHLEKNPLSECDVKNYYHLVTACVVGAYKSCVPLNIFLMTLSSWPSHLDENDSRSEEEVDETAHCLVGGSLLTGAQLKTLENSDCVDAEVLRSYSQLLSKHWKSCLPNHCYVLPSSLQKIWEKGDYSKGMLDQVVLTSYTWLLMLCEGPDQHWVLLVANVHEKTVGVVNTASEKYPNIALELVDHWRKYMKARSSHTGQNLTRWQLKDIPVFEQADNTSSGVHVLMAAESLLCGVAPIIMRSCHVRRYRQYILNRLLNIANFDTEKFQSEEGNDNYHMSSLSASGCDNHFPVVSEVVACSSSGAAWGTGAVHRKDFAQSKGKHLSKRSSCNARKRTCSQSSEDDQDKAIDFSRSSSETHVSAISDTCENYTAHLASNSCEHDYACPEHSSEKMKPGARFLPSGAGPLAPVSHEPDDQEPSTSSCCRDVSSEGQKLSLLYESENAVSSQSSVGSSCMSSGDSSTRTTPFSVQEKPCDMTMQSQLARDAQPSTSNVHFEMVSVEEDLSISGTYDSEDVGQDYNVFESSGTTYTELTNVAASNLQPVTASSFVGDESQATPKLPMYPFLTLASGIDPSQNSKTWNAEESSLTSGRLISMSGSASNATITSERFPECGSDYPSVTDAADHCGSRGGDSFKGSPCGNGQISVSTANATDQGDDLSNLDMLSAVASGNQPTQ